TDGRSELAVSTSARARTLNGAAISGDEFVRAFNEVRAELVSTLYFLLGNHEDALDAAQDAFLKCWRTRHNLAEVRNLRAWIFRGGANGRHAPAAQGGGRAPNAVARPAPRRRHGRFARRHPAKQGGDAAAPDRPAGAATRRTGDLPLAPERGLDLRGDRRITP